MKKENRRAFAGAVWMLAAFAAWTAAVCLVDVAPIGPGGSAVGFAVLNGYVHRLTGVHMTLYVLTDWLSLVPAGVIAGFALCGLVQWIRRKSLRKVDADILILGGFYLTVLAAFVFFEVFVVNCRPVWIGGRLEASYPSSTTMLVLCVMTTAVMQLRSRIAHNMRRRTVTALMMAYTVFMVVCRLVSGVHWFTDIVGGILLSVGLILLYRAVCTLTEA